MALALALACGDNHSNYAARAERDNKDELWSTGPALQAEGAGRTIHGTVLITGTWN